MVFIKFVSEIISTYNFVVLLLFLHRNMGKNSSTVILFFSPQNFAFVV